MAAALPAPSQTPLSQALVASRVLGVEILLTPMAFPWCFPGLFLVLVHPSPVLQPRLAQSSDSSEGHKDKAGIVWRSQGRLSLCPIRNA